MKWIPNRINRKIRVVVPEK